MVFDRKAGTFLCYVYAITPVAAASVLGMAQDTINQAVAYPLTGTVLNPDLVGITLATTIAVSTQTDKDTAAGQAVSAVQEYLNNIRIGDILIINDIAKAIRNVSRASWTWESWVIYRANTRFLNLFYNSQDIGMSTR